MLKLLESQSHIFVAFFVLFLFIEIADLIVIFILFLVFVLFVVPLFKNGPETNRYGCSAPCYGHPSCVCPSHEEIVAVLRELG